jgi:hypothetical protein
MRSIIRLFCRRGKGFRVWLLRIKNWLLDLKPRRRKALLHLMLRPGNNQLLLQKNHPKKMTRKPNLVPKVVLLKKRSKKRKNELKTLQRKKRRVN